MNDSITRLRKLGFPDNLRVALGEMAYCLTQAAGAHIPGLGNDPVELAKDIMLEFIFYGETKKLNPLYELQILEEMCSYAEAEGNQAKLYTVLNFIFSGVDTLRQDLLHKLVSIGVGVQSKKLLDWAAQWMQTKDCTSKISLNVAESVVKDYCVLVPGATCTLSSLPHVSRSFASCFLTAISHIYDTGTRKASSTKRSPFPPSLLRIISDWIHDDSSLCLTSLQSSKQRDSQTCIPGLVHYCILMPCLHNEDVDKDTELLHSQLHMGILQTLLQVKQLPQARGMLCKNDIVQVVEVLTKIQQNLPYSVNTETYKMVVDRLAQFLQVAVETGALLCSQDELQPLCKPIKPTRLLQIVLGIKTQREPMEH